MAATSKSELLAVHGKERAKLSALLEGIDAATADRPDDDATSIRDIVIHRAHWVELFLGLRAAGQRGETPRMPAPGYKWSVLKRYNAELRSRTRRISWNHATARLQAARATLADFIAERDDAALYGGPMPGGGNAWTTGRWAEAAGPSHYRSAAKYIRARLRDPDPAATG